MIATFILFGAAFIVGAVLVVIGGAGAEFADCPAIISVFPADQPHCNLFSGFIGVGGLMTILGGAVASWMLAFGNLPN